jgi:hypothetical protein
MDDCKGIQGTEYNTEKDVKNSTMKLPDNRNRTLNNGKGEETYA